VRKLTYIPWIIASLCIISIIYVKTHERHAYNTELEELESSAR